VIGQGEEAPVRRGGGNAPERGRPEAAQPKEQVPVRRGGGNASERGRPEAAQPKEQVPVRRGGGNASERGRPEAAQPKEPAPMDVTVRSTNRRRRPGVRLHRSSDLEPDEVTTVDGIPITTVGRTLLDLAGVAGSRELEQAVARAERHELVSAEELTRLMARHPKHRGVAALRVLVAPNGKPALARSVAEERLMTLVRKAQLPKPETNTRVAGIEVDFLWRAERLVVEVDGFAFHSSAARFEQDRNRDGRLLARGVQVMRVTWRQLTGEPELVLVRIAQALSQRSARGA
jgi:very-short-patch-repair endonuclease